MLRERLRYKKITVSAAAKTLGISRETLHRKLSEQQPFLLTEALLLHKVYFSEMDFVELFSGYGKEQGAVTPRSVGYIQAVLCQIERGTKNPSLQVSRGIADVFECSIDALLKEEKEECK